MKYQQQASSNKKEQQEQDNSGQQQNQFEQEHQLLQYDEQNLLDEQQEPNLQPHQQQNQISDQIMNRGVCYMSRIPPYMTPNFIKKLLSNYRPERVYLIPQTQWQRNKRVKNGGSKRICFKEGWIQFNDKRFARLAALTLNGQKMTQKKSSFYADDVWTLKYLPKFKWHHLTQRLAHEERLKKERLRIELDQQQKVDQFYRKQVSKSKLIHGIVKKKTFKGQAQEKKHRQFQQKDKIQEQIQ